MATIQEAMSNSTRLLEAAAGGAIEPTALQAEVTALLAANLSARGFMAALATDGLPADREVRAALLAGIKAGKDNAYELIVKNIVMSCCSEQEHALKGRSKEAEGSKATCSASLELAKLLDDAELRSLAAEAIAAIDARAASEAGKDKNSNQGKIELSKWHQFFDRWGYTCAMLEAVKERLASAAGDR